MGRNVIILTICLLLLMAGQNVSAAEEGSNTVLPFQSIDKTTQGDTNTPQLPLPPLEIPGQTNKASALPANPASSQKNAQQADTRSVSASSAPKESGKVRVLEGTGSEIPTAATAPPIPQSPHKKADQPKTKKVDLLYGLNRPLPVSGKPLPALGSLPNADQPTRPYTVNLVDGQNMAVYVSETMPNRIATPFKKPDVVDSSGAKVKVVKGDVYVLPASHEPFGIFISDKSVSRSPVISLTLVPKEVVGQSVVVQIDGTGAGYADEETQAQPANSYTDELKQILRQVIKDVSPQGFTVNPLPSNHPAKKGQLEIIPDRRYSGQPIDVYVYKVTNKGTSPIELTEASFYEKSVRAVAFYPNIHLDENSSTRVFVISWKE